MRNVLNFLWNSLLLGTNLISSGILFTTRIHTKWGSFLWIASLEFGIFSLFLYCFLVWLQIDRGFSYKKITASITTALNVTNILYGSLCSEIKTLIWFDLITYIARSVSDSNCLKKGRRLFGIRIFARIRMHFFVTQRSCASVLVPHETTPYRRLE